MERRVKERLVGAAVLMAAAIILIPEMLSGPKREERPAPTQAANDASMKTYTIDLNRSPGVPTTTPVEERAPPPEEVSSTPQPTQPPLESAPQVSENSTPAPQAVPERATAVPPPVQERVVREPAPPPVASAPAVPTSRGWAVQLGSFASRATADGMVKDLSQQGQSAFVMPVKSGNSTLYRVRIGPFADRLVANKALLEVKGRVPNAAVVAHP